MPASSDVRAVLGFLEKIGGTTSVDAFASSVAAAARELIPCHIASYDEADPTRGYSLAIVDPTDSYVEGQEPFSEHMREHPTLDYYERTGDGSTVKISDFLSRRQFRDTGLYQGVFRPVGTEDIMSTCIRPTPGGVHVAVALHRGKEGFSERERSLLEMLRPHLALAYRNARAHEELRAIRQGLEGEGKDVVVVDDRGRITDASERALRRIRGYFGSASGGGLPDPLVRLRPEGPVPSVAKVVRRGDEASMAVRAVRAPGSRQTLLILSERRVELTLEALAPLGLTPRETEVASWVAQGRTNAEIAEILYVSRSTVKRHLENIYAKLDLDGRSALTALALRVAGIAG